MNATVEYPPYHPGEILFDEFMVPMNISGNRLAAALNVSPARIYQLVSGRQGLSADTALRLARYFGNSEHFWMQLQVRYELKLASDEVAEDVAQILPFDATRP